MLRRIFRGWLFVVVGAALAPAQTQTGDALAGIAAEWFTRPPTPERLKLVAAAADSAGWDTVSRVVSAGSLRAYGLRQEDAAATWMAVARWAEIFGRPQNREARRWLETMSEAHALYSHIDQRAVLASPSEPMARLLKADTLAWMLGDRAFSETFFNQLSPLDYLPRVLAILDDLRASDPQRFGAYAQLALAIALVHDTPPPAHWPHGQVSTEVLPRRLPPPAVVFKYFVDADRAGLTLQKLTTLSAAELRFLVDVAVSPEELAWAQRNVKCSLGELVKSYDSVRYRRDRIDSNTYSWPGKSYELAVIQKEGGICVDQAFFATQAGKARGVPTLLFGGAGRDGRHAWFGYLGASQQWQLDAGRYEDQRYVTGEAIDPQTWLKLSDHELVFLSEGFRRLPPFRLSRQHQTFAEVYLAAGDKAAAAAAARKAVGYERRNFDAWEILVKASDGADYKEREALLREASLAMQRYPDLNARFVRALAASMRARGATSAAEFEERALVRRGEIAGRTDLGVEQAAALQESASPADRVSVYRRVLQQYGRGAGVDFFDRVTTPLVERLIDENRKADAKQVLTMTRSTLKPEFNSQLDRELDALAAKLR